MRLTYAVIVMFICNHDSLINCSVQLPAMCSDYSLKFKRQTGQTFWDIFGKCCWW